MKSNPFRSNAISRRRDGRTELQSCQSAPSPLKQRQRKGEQEGSESVEGWRDHSEGRGSGWGRSQDIRMMAGGGGFSAVIELVWLPVSWILNLPVKRFQHSRTPDTRRSASSGTAHTVHTTAWAHSYTEIMHPYDQR